MKKPETRSETLSIRVTPTLKKAIEACAKRDKRKAGDWCFVELERAARGGAR